MSRAARLLVITFIESLATTLIERGVYFYSHGRLQFTDMENLLLALGFGAAYVAGAMSSHGLTKRFADKPVVVLAVIGQFLACVPLLVQPESSGVLVAAMVALGGFNGLKWPVIESYVSAGRTPSEQARTVGRFNLAWATAVPLGLAMAGPLIGWSSRAMFVTAALMNAASLILVRPLERRPVLLASDHPERPAPERMARYRSLLASSRWSMVGSYSLMWILAALLPHVFEDLGFAVPVATALSGLLDVFRCATFLVLQLYVGWHYRRGPLVWVIIGLPLAFFVTLFGPNLATVLAGELVFGIAAGLTYYAALYYAMIVKNAAVEAGGAHEGIIGVGFVIGPLAGILGDLLGRSVGSPFWWMAVGLAPLILVCAAGAVWFLAKCRPQT